MAVAPVKNVPKIPKTIQGSVTAPPAPKPYQPWLSNAGWGAATQANALPGHDVPGTTANPSSPFTAPVVAAPPKAASTPGYWNKPDYDALLAGDWEPEQAAIKGQKLQGEAETAFQLALRRAFVDYGGDVAGLDEKYRKYIDDPTIEAAKANKFSTLAQNLQASTKALRQQRAQLAARGMSASGANTERTRQALQARELADYTAGRTFTGGAEEGLKGLASTGQQIADMISEAKSRAAARIAQENPQTWIPGTGPDYEGAGAYSDTPVAAAPPAAARAPAGTVNWNGKPMNAQQLAAELSRTGVNRNVWIGKHPAAAQTLGWA